MAMDELGTFMWAIAKQESGHDYGAVGPETTNYGRALGKYQVMSEIAPSWMREVGFTGSDSQLADSFLNDPGVQEKVVSHKMSQYYRRYGRWDLVAIAWFAGPGRADKAAKHGIQSVGGLSDVLGTSVSTYVKKLEQGMAAAPNDVTSARESGGGRTEGTGPTAPMAGSNAPGGLMTTGGIPEEDPNVRRQREDELNQNTVEAIMQAVSSAASQGGGQILDKQAMFGDVFTRTKGVQ